MADRTVTVRLRADISHYSRGMSQAAAEASRTAAAMERGGRSSAQATSRAEAASRRATTAARAAGSATRGAAAASTAAAAASRGAAAASTTHSTALQRLTRAAARSETSLKAARMGSLGLLAAFGLAAAAAARFEKAMSNVKAVTGATGGELEQLRQAALKAGSATQYSATEAADAEAELARAGIKTADIVGGALTGALSLAAAGQLDLSEAAISTAQAMNTFGLKGRDVGHVADVLAAAANKSATDVHGLALGLRMGGLVADQTGLSLEDTVGTLAAFADRALVGSDAGTSLKVMLQRLTPQSKEAQAAMDKLGFSAYDSSGNFVGLSELANRMQGSFKNLTPEARNAAFGVIFGSDAVRSATILYQLGAKGIDKYVAAVDDTGYAARVAATQTDNLVGDLERLQGALETALIQSGTAANSVLRDMVQFITRLVNAYSSLPPSVQSGVTLFAGLAGAIGLVAASTLLLLPRIATVRTELAAMGVTAARTRSAMMMLGRASVIIAALTAISYGAQKVQDAFKDAPPSVSKMANALIDLGRNGKVSGEVLKSFGADLDQFGEVVKRVAHPDWQKRLTDVVDSATFGITKGMGETGVSLDEAREKLDSLDQSLAGLVSSGNADTASKSFKALAMEAEANGTSAEKLMTLLPHYSDALADLDTQSQLTGDGQREMSEDILLTKTQLQQTADAAEQLTDSLKLLNGINIDAAEKEIGFRQSLHDLTESLKENGHSLDITTEKGRKNKQAFLDAAKAAQEHAESVAQQKNSVEAGNAVLEKDIGILRKQMLQAGFSKAAVDALLESFAKIPPKTTAQVKAETAKATADLEAVQNKIRNTKGKSVTVDALTAQAQSSLEALGFKITRTKGKKVTITVPTGSQISGVDLLNLAIKRLENKNVYINTIYGTRGTPLGSGGRAAREAYGGVISRYAGGGTVPGYAPRQDVVPALLSPGEGVLVPEAVRALGGAKAIAAINMHGRYGTARFANGGTVGIAQRYASGGVVTARKEVPGDLTSFTKSLTKSASDISSAAKALTTDLRKLGKSGASLAARVDSTSRRLQDLAKQRDKVKDRIAEAKQYASTETGSVKDFLGVEGGGTAGDLIAQMKDEQATAGQFRKDLARLQAKGLNKDLLSQVIEQGPGSALAKTLLSANSGQFRQINSLAGKGSSLATSIGRLAADALYDAGAKAGKGFLTGLVAQEAALQKEMDKLGKALVAAIKKSLKIKSPSQVMRDQVGKQVGAGVVVGMDQSLTGITAAATRMSAAAVPGLWNTPTAGSAATGDVLVKVYVGDTEIRDIVRVETRPLIRGAVDEAAFRAKHGRR
ncbi:phage tail tape measure protein [Actinacidiphila glaucinigra]|uniref:phage tail tape measure protein n=1 Tax=Actinacidiphila glaucinigra TaxID=235986 RepID=UPI003710DBF6